MLSPQGTEIFARCVIFALLLAPVLLAIWGFLRAKHSVPQEILIFLSALLARTLWRARIEGRIDIPPGQGAIVVSNHTSGVDPWFTKLASKRIIHYLVASEYFYHPAMYWFFRQVGAIPVNRGGIDTAATKQAIRLAEQGHVVGIFPEGRINPTRALLLPGRPGALLIALKARVPVQICYIFDAPQSKTVGGTFLTPSKTRLVVGPLLDISEYYGREKEDGVLAELTLRVLKEIAVVAGHPEFEPRLAGKNWKPRDDE
jgi:1-acyl-sn-glycerol-3-phosphate acyltransferase